jgi:hypothetical protein
MYDLGNDFFAHAAFARNKHGQVGGGYGHCGFKRMVEFGIITYDVVFVF